MAGLPSQSDAGAAADTAPPAPPDLPDAPDVIGPSEPHLHDIAGRLRLVTARLARQLRRHTGVALSPTQHSALASVEVHGPLTLGRLAELEQVRPPTMTRTVDRLESDGLVSRIVDASDRRHTHVVVTEAGHLRMEESRRLRTAWLVTRISRVTPEERRTLEAALDVLETLAARETQENHDNLQLTQR